MMRQRQERRTWKFCGGDNWVDDIREKCGLHLSWGGQIQSHDQRISQMKKTLINELIS